MFRQPQGKKLSESSEELISAKVVERLSLLIPTTALLRDNSIPTISTRSNISNDFDTVLKHLNYVCNAGL